MPQTEAFCMSSETCGILWIARIALGDGKRCAADDALQTHGWCSQARRRRFKPSHTMGWNSRWQGMLRGRFELSILFNAQGLPEVTGFSMFSMFSPESHPHPAHRIHHLTLEFGDLFFFRSNFHLSLLLTMHSSIASFASFALHSSLLVPFKKTLAVRSFRLQAYHPFQLILRFAFFTLFSAFVSPQVLLSASILASQTYHFFECLNCFRFALSLAALSPAKACVEPGCPNLVGFKSRTRLRFWRSQIFSSLAVLL